MRVEAFGDLAASPERVWSSIERWEEQSRWIRDAVWVRLLTPERAGVGARIEVLNRVLHVPLFTERLEVVRWEPPRTMVLAHRSFVRGTGTWSLQHVDGSTRFTWTEELSLPIPVLGELALLAYRPFLRRLMRGSLANLQRLIAAT
ncbi:MAG TPA: SRPBCC family protein [Actinomycetota bacterium]|nr:SRPBCC family protein [Actinomycetota bacterium]